MTEQRKEYMRGYRQKNKDRVKGNNKEYYKKNRDKFKDYYDKNKEKIKDTVKKWRVNNKGSVCNIFYKRYSRTKETDINGKYLTDLKRNTTHCNICGKKFKINDVKHLDHIIPLNIGGTHTRLNVRYVHAKCNLQRPKNGSDIMQFKLAM